MPAQSRSKQQKVRGAKPPARGARAGRRAQVKSTTDVPILAIAVGGLLVVLFVGLLIYGAINNRTSTASTPPVVAGSSGTIPCDRLERTQVHYHAALQIFSGGTPHPLPSGIGIQGGEGTATCFYWLHVHAAYKNVIHIESPSSHVFTLGDFFKVWDAFNTYNGGPHERLSAEQVSTLTVTSGQTVVVYVDLGDKKGPQLATNVDPSYADPNKIVLKDHEVITIEITPPPPVTPPAYDWAAVGL
jgi:hypothetical protein